MESMEHIMRSNDYKNDPYSLGNPMNAICSRGDLEEVPENLGCIDTKVMPVFSQDLGENAIAGHVPREIDILFFFCCFVFTKININYNSHTQTIISYSYASTRYYASTRILAS